MSDELEALVDPGDREYVAGIAEPAQRAVVFSSLLRHRAPERLRVGDGVPAVDVVRLDPYGTVRLDTLCGGLPVMLVFGSYT